MSSRPSLVCSLFGVVEESVAHLKRLLDATVQADQAIRRTLILVRNSGGNRPMIDETTREICGERGLALFLESGAVVR
jgi:hypothetical protein